jgi:predicted NBD/HSP70 family sugar kinase
MRKNPNDQSRLIADVILHVRRGRANSRRSLADVMGVSPSTSGLYVDMLVAGKMLMEDGLEQGPVGRPKRRLRTVPGAGWFAGVEFHAGRIQAVRVDFSGRVVHQLQLPLPAGAGRVQVQQQLAAGVRALGSAGPGRLLGIGVGAPGVVDPERGISLHYAFIDDWREVPVSALLMADFRVPVTLENNLRVIALAERWFGGGRDLEDYVILGPRQGFGVAVMHRGHLFGGAHQAAGEIGNWAWPGGGEMHDVLSAPAVWRRLAGQQGPAPEDLHAALAGLTGQPARSEISNDFARVVGWLQLLLDTHVFFLHGPLNALGASFWDEVAALAAVLMPRLRGRVPCIRLSELDDAAGALGAASLAMESWQPSV